MVRPEGFEPPTLCWPVSMEVIGDDINLQADLFGLVDAARQLAKSGFNVLPYCTEDWVLCSG
jgi:thiazole synthase